MRVTSNLFKAMVLGYAQCLEYGTGGHHTAVAGQRAQPDNIGVLVRD